MFQFTALLLFVAAATAAPAEPSSSSSASCLLKVQLVQVPGGQLPVPVCSTDCTDPTDDSAMWFEGVAYQPTELTGYSVEARYSAGQLEACRLIATPAEEDFAQREAALNSCLSEQMATTSATFPTTGFSTYYTTVATNHPTTDAANQQPSTTPIPTTTSVPTTTTSTTPVPTTTTSTTPAPTTTTPTTPAPTTTTPTTPAPTTTTPTTPVPTTTTTTTTPAPTTTTTTPVPITTTPTTPVPTTTTPTTPVPTTTTPTTPKPTTTTPTTPKPTTTTTTPPPMVYVCPSGFKQFENSYCYWVSSSKASWTSADSDCKRRGLHLARIRSSAEQSFVAGLLKDNTWIDLNDREKEKTFRFTDSTSTSYSNWSKGEPSNGFFGFFGGEDCVELMKSRNYQWNDESCDSSRYYVCQTKTSLVRA